MFEVAFVAFGLGAGFLGAGIGIWLTDRQHRRLARHGRVHVLIKEPVIVSHGTSYRDLEKLTGRKIAEAVWTQH